MKRVPFDAPQGRESEARLRLALAKGLGARVSFSGEGALQYALRAAFSAETCIYAIPNGSPWPKVLLGEGTADGTVGPFSIRDIRDVEPIFGGGTGAALAALDGASMASWTRSGYLIAPTGPVEAAAALSLHYLACQRAIREWARSARPFNGTPDIDTVIRQGSEGMPLPEIPGGAASTPAIPGLILPGIPQGGNLPGMPGYDPSQPWVLPGPGDFGVVPSGIRTRAAFSSLAARKGFDPQPDPPGFGANQLGVAWLAPVIVGVLAAVAIAANAWYSSKEHEQDTSTDARKADTLSQVHVATELATQAYARGQKVDIPAIVAAVGGREMASARAEPYLVGGALAAGVVAIGAAALSAKGII